ncbi:MAG: hypothetical protein IPO37_04510 [Saprospiraceae bacterium]|nr:hypothetical protein [Saprospiraceae bacterium]
MQKSHQANAPNIAVTMDRHTTTERTPACKTSLAKVAVQCSADTFVVWILMWKASFSLVGINIY